VVSVYTGEQGRRVGDTVECGDRRREAETKQQPADQLHRDAVMTVMLIAAALLLLLLLLETEPVERRHQHCHETGLEQQHVPTKHQPTTQSSTACFAPGTPRTMDSSSLGARCRLGHDETNTTQQGRTTKQ